MQRFQRVGLKLVKSFSFVDESSRRKFSVQMKISIHDIETANLFNQHHVEDGSLRFDLEFEQGTGRGVLDRLQERVLAPGSTLACGCGYGKSHD